MPRYAASRRLTLKRLAIILGILAVSVLALGGCGKPEPLKVGKIDTSKLWQQFPQFKTLNEEMQKLQQEVQAMNLPRNRPPTAQEKTKFETAMKKYEELKLKFLTDTFKVLKDTTWDIAEKERLDLVVRDVPCYGGTDITDLITYKLKSIPEKK